MIVLWVLLWIFAIIVGIAVFIVLLALFLLVIPAKYMVTVTDNSNYTIRATYLFRLIRFYYENIGGTVNSRLYIIFFRITPKKKEKMQTENIEKPSKNENIPPEKPKKESIFRKFANTYEVLTDGQGKTIIKQAVGTLKKIIISLKPDYFNVSGSVGLACPFKTGLFFGAYETIMGIFPTIKEKIQLAGDFDSDTVVFRLNAVVRGKITALRILSPIFFMAIKKPMRTFLLDMLKGRK